MRIIGCDLHARQQTIAMLDTDTRELVGKTLKHDGDEVRSFYASLSGQVLVGIEATGSMHWFLNLMEELRIDCQVGHPAKIRKAETRKQKHDRRDAALLLKLLAENRSPSIWMPSNEQRDLGALLLHRHQWVRMRTILRNGLQAIALSNGLRRGSSLWTAGRPTHNRILATGAARSGAAHRIAGFASSTGGTDQKTPRTGQRTSLAAARSTAVNDSSRSRSCHGFGHRSISRRHGAIRGRQSAGQLCGDDPQRAF